MGPHGDYVCSVGIGIPWVGCTEVIQNGDKVDAWKDALLAYAIHAD